MKQDLECLKKPEFRQKAASLSTDALFKNGFRLAQSCASITIFYKDFNGGSSHPGAKKNRLGFWFCKVILALNLFFTFFTEKKETVKIQKMDILVLLEENTYGLFLIDFFVPSLE